RSITMTDFVPSIFNALVEMIDSSRSLVEKLSSLQCLLIGGEAINVKTVNKFRRLLPNVHLTNTYGPTEASIGMVFHDVSEEDSSDIPLGLPIDNTFLAILDEHLEPVPSGEVGEIFIGGECLGTGYLGDSQKTDAAFIANPIPAIPGDKLYRTGDLGRLDSRGRACFCGRVDNQTKVNGVRIELGEIEHALLSHEHVNEAVVVSIEKGALHTKKLCAFVTSRNLLSADILRRYLSTLLPEYMLPNEYVFRAELPLTPNGKVDRQSLINSLKTMPQNGDDDESISSVEKELLNRFRNALSADRLGVDDNFFEFGGDSLSALEVALGAGVDSHIKLEVGDIYAWPTVHDLAIGISERGAAESKSTVDWELESQLANDIKVPYRTMASSRPKEILITGATGFVGAHLLFELLQSTSARITALVRDGDSDAATRCRQALDQYGLWRDAFAKRLIVVPGDLSKPNLGLEPATWSELEEGIDSIVHCGAMVDLLRSYSQHRPHNVTGTMEVIRLATSKIPKHLHYVSTLSVFEIPTNGNHSDLIQESDVPNAGNLPLGGYQQSKSVAENLIRKVEANGLSATIYRLGEIGPSSETGLSNNKSFINLLLNGCVRLGVFPTSSFSFDWTPVDAVAKAMAYCIGNGLAAGETFHVMQQRSISFRSIIDCLIEAGMPLRVVTHPDLCAMLEDIRSTDGASDLTLLRALLPPASGSGDLTNILVDAQRYYRRDRFEQLLQSSTISFPEHDERTLAARFVHSHSNTVSKLAAAN
ncbi:MAG TPA: thioester reductase domain-containing protein, partial [Pyrinomonadaceae bacterium]